MSSTALATLTNKLAQRFDMGEGGKEVFDILKATAFKGPASDAQITALLVVANQYGLNPWTKEIYAFPDKNNGIVPVVGVDGWSRIINEHPQFDGMDFEETPDACTCVIYRKDRAHPIKVTEYKDECARNTGPWQSHPRRMLRHKALIQCARLAFGYVGIYDQDEAERIAEIDVTPRANGAQVAAAARPQVADTPERQSLLAELENVAKDFGLDAYSKSWAGLTPAERKMIGVEEHTRLKTLATTHGAIDAEFTNVDEQTGELPNE